MPPVNLTLPEVRCLFFLAARHAIGSPGFGMTAFCRMAAANAGVMGRAECKVIGELLAAKRPPVNMSATRYRLCVAAEEAMAKRLAELVTADPSPPQSRGAANRSRPAPKRR